MAKKQKQEMFYELAGLDCELYDNLPTFGQKIPVYIVEDLRKYRGAQGEYYYEHFTIAIDAGLPDDRKDETLLHEFLHACLHETGLFLEFHGNEELEERMVRALASMVHHAGWRRVKKK